MKNSRIKIFIILVIAVFVATIIYQNYYKTNHYTAKVLDYYGFASAEKKNAIQDLFRQSSIIPDSSYLEDIFPPRNNKLQLVWDILTLVRETQNKFTIRSGTKERWEVQPLEWMLQNKDRNLNNLKILGFVDAITPKQKQADAICILGATNSTMSDRIEYANLLIDQGLKAKNIILLAGERYVTQDIDGQATELSEVAKQFNLTDWRKVTETHLIQYLYNKSALSNKKLAVYVIDTPKRDLPRPTTQTTILELISWLRDHNEIQDIIFVSNQPYVKYQKAIIDLVFKEQAMSIKYDVVGSAVLEVDVQPILEGLGSYIWAASPGVLSDMNININNEAIKKIVKELYSTNQLIYQTLPQNFK